jgi:O-methyltransferase involved in polyketide biosynthesis
MGENHHLISPTAALVAYARGLDGQPGAADISRIGNCEAIARSLIGDSSTLARMCAHMHARYRAVHAAIVGSGCCQVLGIGEGLAPYGMLFTKNPDFRYVVTDLPDILGEAGLILAELEPHPHSNLFLRELNALDAEEVRRVASECLIPGQPVVINVEGVFPYLDDEERVALFTNARQVLDAQGGGEIVVTGIVVRDPLGNGQGRARAAGTYARIEAATGRNMMDLAPEDKAAAAAFFSNMGFWADPIDFGQHAAGYNPVGPAVMEPADALAVMNSMTGFVLTLR